MFVNESMKTQIISSKLHSLKQILQAFFFLCVRTVTSGRIKSLRIWLFVILYHRKKLKYQQELYYTML